MPASLAAAHRTEHHLLRIICDIHEQPGYAMFRSEDFPGYFDGNYLELRAGAPGIGRAGVAAMGLAELERLFCAHFDQRKYAHVHIMGLEDSGIKALLADERAGLFTPSRASYLFADQPLVPTRPLAEDLCIRRVDTPARWQLMRAFDEAADRNQPWYTPEVSAMLSARRERVSAVADITWLYVSPRAHDTMLAKLGLFAVPDSGPDGGDNGPVCRLQDVETSPAHRRRGLATALVAAALDETLHRRAAAGLYVCADTNDLAIHMYRKQGFRDLGELWGLFRTRAKEEPI